MHLNLLNPALRIDWPLLLAAVAVGITLLGAAAIALQIRRTRRRVMGTLERVFEQLDLMRLETLPANGAHAPPVQLPAVAQPPAPLATPRARPAPAELADYQGAARLAAHGAPMAEIAERCGVVAGEARVLLALQRAAQQRAPRDLRAAAAVAAPERPAPVRPVRTTRGGVL
jgi:hypothetical protein